ncbi:rtel1 protein [Stylonychia lemnae]|uniref:Regulator of telomere elongation helicase 1 homolog n=1 Tax=Stylonychia lemnae TaxID=5949 RepID=A0A078AQ99_STYLE|nr:rtel1 protein [Stylonychia lemnae]|eukprot:CDW83417.1 rtel1 protein [Stylonychia lemnae]
MRLQYDVEDDGGGNKDKKKRSSKEEEDDDQLNLQSSGNDDDSDSEMNNNYFNYQDKKKSVYTQNNQSFKTNQEPYQQQVDYMSKVIEACQKSSNALLESPTGTGKTLCLLTASLSWLKKIRESNELDEDEMPRIIYCSRTHSQISQVMNELKHTAYKPKVCLIGSRDQLCVNPTVNQHKGMALNSQCKKVREQRKDSPHCCTYFKNTGDSVTPNGFKWDIQDVEDLHKLGSSQIVCPYYLQKSRIQYSDLILMPYNYLIDPKIRENFKINYENSIIIMDEAHNVERVAEDVASFEIHINQLHTVLGELNDFEKGKSRLDFVSQYIRDYNFDTEFFELFEIVQHKKFKKIENTRDKRIRWIKDYREYRGLSNFEGLKPTNFGHWTYIFEKVMAGLTESNQYIIANYDRIKWETLFRKMVGCDEINHYYVYMRQEDVEFDKKRSYSEQEKENRIRSARSLGFWCFNPGLGFKKIVNLKPRTLILTSGTLYPMKSFSKELMIGVQGNQLNFAHKFRELETPIKDLGETLVQITEKTPGGMLIFFPSYQVLSKFYELWEQNGIIKKFERFKSVLQEPRDSSHYKFVITAFYEKVYERGAIIFAVCRGKISEGLDFSDDAARCVIIIGIPYPMTLDPKTILKKHYLDKENNKYTSRNTNFNGQQWYCQQATRATNQAIGRVIRHVQDYGNIILIDERFDTPQQRQQITSWLRDSVKVYSDAFEAIRNYELFYAEMKKRNFVPKVKQLGQVKLDFPEIDDDLNLKDTVDELKRRAKEESKCNEANLQIQEIFDIKKALGTPILLKLFKQFLQLSLGDQHAYRKRFKSYLTIKDQSNSTRNHIYICRQILETLFQQVELTEEEKNEATYASSDEEDLKQQFELNYMMHLKKQLLAFFIKRIDSYQAQQDFIVMISGYLEKYNASIEQKDDPSAIKLDSDLIKSQLSQAKTYAQQINEKIFQQKQKKIEKQSQKQVKKLVKVSQKQKKKKKVDSEDDYQPTPSNSSDRTLHTDNEESLNSEENKELQELNKDIQ